MNYLKAEENDILKKAKSKIRALFHPLRQEMLVVISKHDNSISVTEIYTRLKIEQSVASQHLAILRKEGFVSTRRDGKTIWYSVEKEYINEFVENCANVLASEAVKA